MDIPDVGLLALEDAETGEIAWVDTSLPSWRKEFQARNQQRYNAMTQVFNSNQVDRVSVTTSKDYSDALTHFFKQRARRLRR
jgi:hypothetical protein